MKFLSDFLSDITAMYSAVTIKTVFKSFFNPSMHACFLIRLSVACKYKFLHIIVRNLLITKHSIDIGFGAVIGKSLLLPHPIGIVIGQGVIIGNNVKIFQNCTLGDKEGYPQIENFCVIYPNSVLVGKILVGESSIVGANTFLDKDIESKSKYYGRT